MSNPSTLDQDRPARPDSQTTNEPGESFGDLLSQFEQSHTHHPEVGGKGLEGTVIQVSGESVFLDIGYKIEGIIPLADFTNAGDKVQRGDKVIVSIKGRDPEGYYQLSRIRVEDGRIRACVAMLGISVECAGKFLPGIFKQEQEADTQ